MQQRYYDPIIGRFYSNDPVGFTASNPMMFNRYAYANNNPFKFVDPDGRRARLVRPLPVAAPVGGSTQPHIPGHPDFPNHTGGAAPALPNIDIRKGTITGVVINLIQAAVSGSNNSTEQKGQGQPEIEECPLCGGNTTDKEGRMAKDHGISRGEVRDRIHDIKGGRISGNPNVEVCSDCGEVFPQSQDGTLGDTIGNIKDEIDY